MQPKSDPKANRQIIFMLLATLAMIAVSWRSCWYGAPMSDSAIEDGLKGDDGEQEIQRALSNVVKRIEEGADGYNAFYPAVLALETHDTIQIRATAAWTMGAAKDHQPFTEALLRMIADKEELVRQNAALALAGHNREEGRTIILGMLLPSVARAPHEGEVVQLVRKDEPMRAGMRVARVRSSDGTESDITSPIDGTVKRTDVGLEDTVTAQASLVVIQPSGAQYFQALRALMKVGKPTDLEAINQFLDRAGRLSEEVQLQAEALKKRLEAQITR